MTDLFQDKAADWDERPVPAQISAGVVAAIRAHVPLEPTMRVLDFGAGTGLVCLQLAADVEQVVAVDISPSMLDKLAEKAPKNVEVRCHDLLDSPLDREVDLVISAMALHHVEDTGALVRALSKALRPDGLVALADLDKEDGSFHPAGIEGVFHHGFERTALQAELEAGGFVDVNFTTACEVRKEDRAYGVFLVTARKAAS